MAYARYDSTAPNTPVAAINPMAFGSGSTLHGVGSSAGVGGKTWLYISTHTQAEVGTSDFISDGRQLGMKIGDSLINAQIAAKHSFHRVTNVSSTFTSLSAGLCISSAS
jgi:hypothetical protein